MRTVEEVRARLCAYLKEKGLAAVDAWTEIPRRQPGQPVAAVSLRALESGPPGFQNYLGERWDEAKGQWLELYGKKVILTFGLDIYAATADKARTGLELLSAALEGEGPGGLRPTGFSAGEVAYRPESKQYVCPAEARFSAWAVMEAGEDGSFLDFEVKGEFQ